MILVTLDLSNSGDLDGHLKIDQKQCITIYQCTTIIALDQSFDPENSRVFTPGFLMSRYELSCDVEVFKNASNGVIEEVLAFDLERILHTVEEYTYEKVYTSDEEARLFHSAYDILSGVCNQAELLESCKLDEE